MTNEFKTLWNQYVQHCKDVAMAGEKKPDEFYDAIEEMISFHKQLKELKAEYAKENNPGDVKDAERINKYLFYAVRYDHMDIMLSHILNAIQKNIPHYAMNLARVQADLMEIQ